MRLFCAGAGLFLLISTSGSARRPEWQDAPQATSRLLAARFVACALKSSRPSILKALDEPFGDAETVKRFQVIMSGNCQDEVAKPLMLTTESVMSMTPLVERGLLYEELYRDDYGLHGPTVDVRSSDGATYPVANLDSASTMARDYRALMRIGECTVRAAPNDARGLVLSAVASRAETKALAALSSAWMACLPPAAKQLNFTPAVQRGAIAEPLYRLSLANSVQVSGTTH